MFDGREKLLSELGILAHHACGMRREIERIDKQLKRLVDAILEGADAKPINAKLKELDAEKERLTEVLSAAPDDKPLLHPNLAKVYRDRVENLEMVFRGPERGRERVETFLGRAGSIPAQSARRA